MSLFLKLAFMKWVFKEFLVLWNMSLCPPITISLTSKGICPLKCGKTYFKFYRQKVLECAYQLLNLLQHYFSLCKRLCQKRKFNAQATLSVHILTPCDLTFWEAQMVDQAQELWWMEDHTWTLSPITNNQIPLRLAFTVLLFWLLCNKKLMVMILQFNNTSIHFMKDSPSQLSFLLAEFNSLWCEKSSSISPLMVKVFPRFFMILWFIKKQIIEIHF